ncbi:MAG: hypothetical protein U9Q06_00060 [Nanoarchaeota archaeon]|nr:hypothetical protein [Nanoarchaeota archaeon]
MENKQKGLLTKLGGFPFVLNKAIKNEIKNHNNPNAKFMRRALLAGALVAGFGILGRSAQGNFEKPTSQREISSQIYGADLFDYFPEPVAESISPKVEEVVSSGVEESYSEIINPQKYSDSESDSLTLARLIYAEARSEWKNERILEHKGSSVLNRTKNREISVKDAIFQKHQYKAIRDDNKSFFYNPTKSIEKSIINKRAWEKCYAVADELIKNGPKYETEFTIHQERRGLKPEVEFGWVKGLEEIEQVKSINGIYYFYKKR